MIERILIIAMITIGYCCIFWEGMIFERIGLYADCYLPAWLWKPLGGCYICACMWIGSAIYMALYGIPKDMNHVVVWLLTCIGAMGVNAAISILQPKQQNE